MTTTIRNVRIVELDARYDGTLVDVVFGDTITTIRPADAATPPGGDSDGGGYLMPGLIDTHVHLGGRDALVAAAHAGVTTVVDLGTFPDSLIAEHRAEKDVPAILSAGSAASAPGSSQITRMGFPVQSGITSAADAERYLAWRSENGADLIKIIIEDPDATDVPALDVATISAVVSGAHDRGLLTVAHVVTAAAFERGLEAGVDILTHAPLDRPLPRETVQRMLDQKTIASPTLIMMRTMAVARLGDRADSAFQNALESVRRMHTAGIPIITGTDANETRMAPVQLGSSLHDEIGYLQLAGMTAAEALRAGTSDAAAAFRLKDRGIIAEGRRADLVLLDSNPLAEPAAARLPRAVWIAGTRA